MNENRYEELKESLRNLVHTEEEALEMANHYLEIDSTDPYWKCIKREAESMIPRVRDILVTTE